MFIIANVGYLCECRTMRYFMQIAVPCAMHRSGQIRRLGTKFEKSSTWPALVGGQDVVTDATFPVVNPRRHGDADANVVANVANLTATHAQTAIDVAYSLETRNHMLPMQAFKEGPWARYTAKQRSDSLRKWFNLCMENHDDLATLLHTEQGKSLTEARGEITYGSSFIEWFAEEARRLDGRIIDSPAPSKRLFVTRQPVGVAAMITPWNFPNAMVTRKVAAALAAGCTCIVKPAEDTPLSCLAIAQLASEAGIPGGVFNVLTADSANSVAIGKLFCQSNKVAALSFTGSTDVGKILYEQCGCTVKKLALELGGNAPFIVFNSANLDSAVEGLLASKFRNSGQTCVSSNRILVQSGIHDEFIEMLTTAIKERVITFDRCSQFRSDQFEQGPIVNSQQHNSVCRIVEESIEMGANLVIGGHRQDGESGLSFQPTLLTDVKSGMPCFEHEIFGPVVAVTKFETEQDALNLANAGHTGLSSYLYSEDIAQTWRVAEKLEAGMVGINEGILSCCEAPFGGTGQSGIGREGSYLGCDEYLETKYICLGNMS